MHSVWRPDKVMEAIKLGIDMFDSSYPYIVTERGCGLTFNFDLGSDPEQNEKKFVPAEFEIDLEDKK